MFHFNFEYTVENFLSTLSNCKKVCFLPLFTTVIICPQVARKCCFSPKIPTSNYNTSAAEKRPKKHSKLLEKKFADFRAQCALQFDVGGNIAKKNLYLPVTRLHKLLHTCTRHTCHTFALTCHTPQSAHNFVDLPHICTSLSHTCSNLSPNY